MSVSDSSAWAPLRQRAFRWLWLGVLISWTGTWMQTVGAQWLLVDAPNAAALVSFVQAATTLPVMLLGAARRGPGRLLRPALAAVHGPGLLLRRRHPARRADRRRADAAGTAAGLHLRSSASAPRCSCPTWRATLPELVPRTQLRAAPGWIWSASTCPARSGRRWPVWSSLTSAASRWSSRSTRHRWSSSRSPCSGGAARRGTASSRERFVPALRAGGRYVWHEPVVRRILLRAIMFVAPAMALWALLPLVASQHWARSRRLRCAVRRAGRRRHRRRLGAGTGMKTGCPPTGCSPPPACSTRQRWR